METMVPTSLSGATEKSRAVVVSSRRMLLLFVSRKASERVV
jgi:hypothetical protein